MKRLLIIALAIPLFAGLLFAGGKAEQTKVAVPDVVEVMTWDNDDASISLLGEQPMIEYVEKLLNIDIRWRLFSHADRDTVINLMIAAGGQLPDLFVAFGNISGRVLAEKGVIIPWSDFMEAGKMPLTVAKLNDPKFIGVKNQITDDATGKIYAMPYLNINPMMIWTDYVREDWMDKLGLKDPTTPEELRDVLRAFKTRDPNGNGKADEIPWINFYEGVTWIKMWSRMFGLPTPDYSLSTVDTLYWATVNSEKIVFAPTDERFKAMLEYLNSLWKEGLISQDQFNMTSPKFAAVVANNTLGTQNMWPSAIPGQQEALRQIEPKGTWHAIPYPVDPRFMKPENRQYAAIGPVHQQFMISKSGKGTEAAIRLIDYVFGDEDFVFTNEFGIEGVHHEIGADGLPHYIGKWAEMTESVRIYSMGSMLGRLPHEHRNIGQLQRFETDPLFADYKAYLTKIDPCLKPATLWKLSEEQRALAKDALQVIQTYVDEAMTKFIIGAKPFSEWDEYVKTVNKQAGSKIEAARQMYQDYFDKYVKAYY